MRLSKEVGEERGVKRKEVETCIFDQPPDFHCMAVTHEGNQSHTCRLP